VHHFLAEGLLVVHSTGVGPSEVHLDL
jgi:hypothetical protein